MLDVDRREALERIIRDTEPLPRLAQNAGLDFLAYLLEHTHSAFGRLEIVETGRRRRWSDEEKRRIVLESMSGPRQVSATARRHNVARSQILAWRRAMRRFVDTNATNFREVDVLWRRSHLHRRMKRAARKPPFVTRQYAGIPTLAAPLRQRPR